MFCITFSLQDTNRAQQVNGNCTEISSSKGDSPPVEESTPSESSPATMTTKKASRKKTVTFKTVLETSDDITVKKVYNPTGTPLVPIIKKDSILRATESIVKPSRLTEIVKQSSFNNLNRLKTLGFGTNDDRDEDDEEEDEEVPLVGEVSTTKVTNVGVSGPEEVEESSPTADSPPGNVSVGDKRFILPKRSLHSRRVIKPNKKFLDDMDGCSAKALKRVNSGSKIGTSNKSTAKTETAEAERNVISSSATKGGKSVGFAELPSKEVTLAVPAIEVSLKKENDLASKEVASLFGQPISSVGTDLNLTPFGSNKVILRQPRLQFAMPIATQSTTTNNLFGFSSISGDNSSVGSSGSTLSQPVPAIPLKSNLIAGSGKIKNLKLNTGLDLNIFF